MPGDVLQIEILEIALVDDWGWVGIRPLMGTLPEEFDAAHIIHPVDRSGPRRLPAALGQGTGARPVLRRDRGGAAARIGAAARRCSRANSAATWTTRSCAPAPRSICRCFNEGALFYAGDGHGVQGDGEVCVTALETSLAGTFRLTVRKDLDFAQPFAESPTHLISIGLNEDLDEAARQAVREMIAHVCRRTSLKDHEAYMLCSLAGDLRVTQTVDGVKGCHMMLAKSCL